MMWLRVPSALGSLGQVFELAGCTGQQSKMAIVLVEGSKVWF